MRKIAIRKSLASMLSLTLLASLLIAPSGARAATVDMPLTNPGFEEPLSSGKVPGWSSIFAVKEGSYTYAVTNAKSAGGLNSLKITDTTSSNSVALQSDKLPVTPGTAYTASAKLLIESGGIASLNLRYFNSANVSIGEAPIHNDPNKGFTRGQWNPTSTTMTAPADAAYARIIVYTTAFSTSTAYYDDIRFTYSKPDVIPGVWNLSAPAAVQTDQEFDAAVSLSEVKELSSVQASVYYDTSRLELVSVSPAGAFAGDAATFSSSDDNGTIKLIAAQKDGKQINADTELATVRFRAKAENGTAWVLLSKGTTLNETYALNQDQVRLVTIGTGSSEPIVPLDQIRFGAPEYRTTPIADAVGVFDGEAGVEDGHNVMYTTVKGIPPLLHVVDLDDYRLIRSVPLEGGGEVWNHAIAPDGTVYITSAGQLWSYSPVTKQAQKVFTFAGESTFWCLAIDERGNVYVGTGPGGKILKYDPVTKQSRDYGRLVTDINQVYVRAIDYSNGYIYAGTSNSKVYRLNVETGEKVELASSLGEKGYVYDLNIVDDKFVVVRYDTPQRRYIYDIEKGEWLDLVIEKSSSGLQLPKKSLNGKIYMPVDKKIVTFDVVTHALEDSGMAYETAFRGANWVQADDPELPGTSLVTMNFAGIIVFMNPQTGLVKRYPNLLPPNATVTNKFTNGPDGKIYVTGMQASKAAAYDIASNMAATFPMGQAGAVTSFGNKMYFGVYPGGDVFEYDLSLPAGSTNPKRLFIIENEQDRPGTAIVAGNKVYIGSVATYGAVGGAITSFDPSSPDAATSYRVYRNVVQDQSVISLAYKDGKVYGSTSINGGVAADPKAKEAKLFVWDTVKEEKITEASLDIPGLTEPPAIGGLSFGPDGLLWGGANGYIFAMDPKSLKVIKYSNINPADNGTGFRWGNFRLEWSKDGILFAMLGKKLYAIDPSSFSSKYLCDAETFTIGVDGNLYYAPSENRTLMNRITVRTPAEIATSLELAGLAPMVTGDTGQTSVTVQFLDGSRRTPSTGIFYSSSNPQVATIDQAGKVTAVSHGEAVITATYDGVSASYTLTVSPALTSIAISGLDAMKEGDTKQTLVSAAYSDGSSVTVSSGITFSSSNQVVAAIDESGNITAGAIGETVITATYGGKSAEYRLAVTASLNGIAITKLKPMKESKTLQVTVTAKYSDGTAGDVTMRSSFKSSVPEAATISAAGLVTALAKGKTEITAAYAGKEASDKLVVTKKNEKNEQD
ncbi:Ig-like domain-containing protein [Paenibacillus sp. MBLB4367]|uniref:Ig-like domain-containing protein n=1 Tax=Paenibacillus sp. MBLB4367 TaxID=3384767 RepID=UPI00390825B2